MDSDGRIYKDPTQEEIEKKKLVPVDPAVRGLSRRERRKLYRREVKAMARAAQEIRAKMNQASQTPRASEAADGGGKDDAGR